MAKRLLIASVMMLLIISFVMAVDSFEPLSVEFTVDDKVYAGFTGSKVVSTIKPEEKIEKVYFTYSSDDNSFIVSNLYYYVQTFTSENIKISLSGTPLTPLQPTAGVQSDIKWQSISVDTAGLSSNSPFTYTEQYEPEMNSHQYPRVYSGEIFIKIPIENVLDSTTSYKATLTLEVTKL